MKIIESRDVGETEVFDLKVDHDDHSFVHASGVVLHNCGYVIASRPIKEFASLTPIKGTLCTEFTANSIDGISSIEGVGGIKYDYLKLNSLRDIQEAVRLIQLRSGEQIPDFIKKDGRVPKVRVLPFKGDLHDIWTSLPEEAAIFREVSKGQTESVFQFSTPGAVKWLKFFDRVDKMGKPLISSVRDMATFTALDRPGPLDIELSHPDGSGKHNALVEYVRRASGQAPSKDILDVFARLFPETHAVMVYQEQLQRAYQELTGCSGAEADEFRANVAKKRADKVAKAYHFFVEKAGAKLGSEELAAQVFQAFGTWAKYGFNLSHALSYARLAYVTAFLKHHFPLEWWTAVMSNATKDDIASKFWSQCSDFIDLPDIARPQGTFCIVNERIQAPIGLLMGIGPKAEEQIVRYAPYNTIEDFCKGIQTHKLLKATTKTEIKEVKGIKKEVTKVSLGRSAIHSGIAYALIISGTMNSLFPKEFTTLEKLMAFEKAMAEASGAKKVNKIKEEFVDLKAYDEFLVRKKLLPVYTQNLVDLMVDCRHPRVSTTYGRPQYKAMGKYIPMWDIRDIKDYEESEQFVPSGGYNVAVAGYVTEVRMFTFGEGREACGITLNIEGQSRSYVRWPDWNSGKLDIRFTSELQNSLVVLHVIKKRPDKGFVIEDIEVLAESRQNGKKK